MVRRSKRGAKSESTDEGDAQDEQVTEQLCTVEHSGEGEVHSDERSILKDVEVTCEPHSLGDQVVGDTEDVQVNQSEKETGEMEIGGGCVTSELNNPKASQCKEAANEVMDLGDDAVAAALAEAETALACESETPLEKESAALAVKAADQPASEKMAAEAVTESDEKEAEQESDEKEAEQEQCLYCDHRGFSVSDVDAYAAHLETEHRVVRNAHLLARITIDTHRQDRLQSARLEAVSPEPFEEVKLPPVEDIESEDDDDDELLATDEIQEEKDCPADEIQMELAATKEKDEESTVLDDSKEKDRLTEALCDTTENGHETMDTGHSVKLNANGEAENAEIPITAEVNEPSSLDIAEQSSSATILEEDLKEEEMKEANSHLGVALAMSPDSNKDNGDMLTIMASGEDGFEADEEVEVETKEKQDDVLSDLSLSDDDFSKNISKEEKEEVKDKEKSEVTGSEEKPKADEELCTKCDTPHPIGQRCTYLLKGSNKRSRPRETSRPRPRIRTLPPELYHHPDDRERSYHSRSPPPTRIRRAPSPPSAYERDRDRFLAEERERRAPPPSNHFGEKRCKLCNMPGHLVKSCPDLFCYVCKQQGHFAKECPGGRDRAHKSPSNTQVEPVFGVAPPPPPAPSYAPAAPPSQEQQGYAQYFPPPVQQQQHGHPMLPSNSVPPPYPVGVPPTFAGSHYQAGPTSMMESNKPAHYAEALSSLAPLQAFMNTKLQYSSSSSGYPPSYIELLVTNVGKMFALANLSLPSLEATFFSHGETFLRSRISRELQVYAQQFPKGVNMPIVTETTVEFLKTQAGLGRQFSY